MVKRFSAREFALLMLPVLFVGALGLWLSKRSTMDDGKPQLSFHLETPTTLEAFRGADAVFVLGLQGPSAEDFYIYQSSPYLQIKTSHGVEVDWMDKNEKVSWRTPLWTNGSSGGNTRRYFIPIHALPAGEMHFGSFAIAQSKLPVAAPPNPKLPPKPLRLSGKWKVDRAQIKSLAIASLPPKPLISLQGIKITRIETKPRILYGEAIFHLDGTAMDSKTPLEFNFSERNGNQVGWGTGISGRTTTSETARRRVREWTVNVSPGQPKIIVTGRVSADNRWPLGFEFEPFSFKTAKVGQKLNFKQFPVALPKE